MDSIYWINNIFANNFILKLYPINLSEKVITVVILFKANKRKTDGLKFQKIKLFYKAG